MKEEEVKEEELEKETQEENENQKLEEVEEVKSESIIEKEIKTEENTNNEVGNDKQKNKNNKKIIIIILLLVVIIGVVIILFNKKDKKSEPKKENSNETSNVLKELPKPEVSGGERGKLGIDKNINESNIDEYLGREDSVYRDMRMLEDPANYESIGGDRFLSGYINGFEVVPLPYLIPVEGLPESVGSTYKGKTLFSIDKNGNYVANYEESRKIIEELFPKDKVIFLMCGGGGYAGMTKNFLVSLGYDENKIYNIGGYWYYEGKNDVKVKKVVDGKTIYDFDSVPYHNIEFDKLTSLTKEEEKEPEKKDEAIYLTSKYYNYDLETKWDSISYTEVVDWYEKEMTKLSQNYSTLCPKQDSKNKENDEEGNSELKEGESLLDDETFPEEDDDSYCPAFFSEQAKIDAEYDKRYDAITNQKIKTFNELLNTDETFIITFNEGSMCGAKAENDPRGFMFDIAYKHNIYVYDVGMDVYKKTKLYKTVKYAPGVIIYSKGEIIAYTDAEKDEHIKLYENEKAFKEWLTKYIKLSK